MVQETLQKLQKAGLCDDQTVETLSLDDPFIQARVEGIAKGYEKFVEDLSKGDKLLGKKNKEAVYQFGNTLLFLEDLFLEEKEVRDQVRTWLEEDGKRALLFDYSPQGELYGKMLVAKAEGELGKFREEYNEGIPAQKPFSLEETLTLTLKGNPNEKEILPTEKLEAVLETIHQRVMGEWA